MQMNIFANLLRFQAKVHLCLGSPLRNKAIEIATVPYLKTTLTALGAYKAIQNNNNNMADRTMLQHGWRRGGIPHVVE